MVKASLEISCSTSRIKNIEAQARAKIFSATEI